MATYRLGEMTAAQSPPTAREVAAEADAADRMARRRRQLRPLGVLVLCVVAVPVALAHPGPSLHGRGVGILAALIVFCVPLIRTLRPSRQSTIARTAALTVMLGAGALALAALQPKGEPELACSAAAYIAVVRLPRHLGFPLGGVITAGLAITEALTHGAGLQGIIASVLLCALLTMMADLVARAGESQDRAELLYAQLQDARDAQAAAAASEERSRIAAELHDVLAHSLSGAAIQLQGARKLIRRSDGDPRITATIDRAAELVRGGLDDARRAVRTLHGDELPSMEQLPALLQDFRRDQDREVSFTVTGPQRRLATDASLALYRGAQEALTNIAKHAPGASVAVTVSHDPARTTLTIEDHRSGLVQSAPPTELATTGGGFGLTGMRERVVRVGGEMDAGATEDGWRVRLQVPV